MTAKLVYHTDRTPFNQWEAESLANGPQLAESGLFNRFRGQLWGRLENATLNSDALTESQWERMAEKRNELGTRSATWGLTSIDDE